MVRPRRTWTVLNIAVILQLHILWVKSQQPCDCPGECPQIPKYNCWPTTGGAVCDCSTCGCSEGEVGWCRYEDELRPQLSTIDYTSTDTDGTSLSSQQKNDLVLLYSSSGTVVQTWTQFLDTSPSSICKPSQIASTFNTCGDREAAFEELGTLKDTIRDHILLIQDMINTLDPLIPADATLKTKLDGTLELLQKIQAFILFLEQYFIEGFQCLSDDQCTERRKNICSGCSCVECETNADCSAKDTNKPFCKPSSGMLVCGDPHIKQTIRGADQKLCYDIIGAEGKMYMFLDDNGMEIIAKFTGGGNSSSSGLVDYVSDVYIKMNSVQIHFKPRYISVDEEGKPVQRFRWATGRITTSIGWISLSKKQVKVYLMDGATTVQVIRKGMSRAIPFLNFGVVEKQGLSYTASGIMGSLGNEAKFVSEEGNLMLSWFRQMFPVDNTANICLKIDPFHENRFNKMLERFQIEESKNIETTADDIEFPN